MAEGARRTLPSCRTLLRSRNLLCFVCPRAGYRGRRGLRVNLFRMGRISGRDCGLGRLALRLDSLSLGLGCRCCRRFRGQLFRSRIDPRFP